MLGGEVKHYLRAGVIQYEIINIQPALEGWDISTTRPAQPRRRTSAYYSSRVVPRIYRLPFLRLPPLMVAPASLTNFLSVPDSFSSRTRSAVDTSIRTPWTSRIGNEGDPVRRWRTGSRVSTSTRSLISMTTGVGRRLKESMRERSSRVTAEGCHL